MADRGIIFSAPMVRALRAGTKAQTRRVLKTLPEALADLPSEMQEDLELRGWAITGDVMAKVPYAVGDRMWVREGWASMPRTAYALQKAVNPNDPDMAAYYRADFDRSGRPPWRSPIHMPRWASRLTLAVTEVRVQRLQEISDEDALAEGVGPRCQPDPSRPDLIWVGSPLVCKAPRLAYRDLWNGIHGPRAWDANPWVVAISFAVERRKIDSVASETERAA